MISSELKQEANKLKNNYIWEVKQIQITFDIGKTFSSRFIKLDSLGEINNFFCVDIGKSERKSLVYIPQMNSRKALTPSNRNIYYFRCLSLPLSFGFNPFWCWKRKLEKSFGRIFVSFDRWASELNVYAAHLVIIISPGDLIEIQVRD